VYLDGTKAGLGPGNIVIEAVGTSVVVAGVSVGELVGVLAGWGVCVIATVFVGGCIGRLVAKSALGPKGVKVDVGCWLGVTVDPMFIGITDIPESVQAARNSKEIIGTKRKVRCSLFSASSIKVPVWVERGRLPEK
jgi:hypothetical protein